jgi:hypothetical protein
VQGEGLLRALRPVAQGIGTGPPTWAVVCSALPEAVLRALPRAVVTAADAARLTQPTSAGPVDLLCLGDGDEAALARALEDFALGPLTFAWRPASETWLDEHEQRVPFEAGRLTLAPGRPDAFLEAPRRLWIAARLIAEFALEADPWLMDRARAGCAERALELPQGAPARRAMSRVLAVQDPRRALAFLEATGMTAIVAPGAQAIHADRLHRLPLVPAIRWAAWLRGTATARAVVTFRIPHPLARRIERAQASHPLDQIEGSENEAALRRLLRRLEPELIDALFIWRRVELEEANQDEMLRIARDRLEALQSGVERLRFRSEGEDRRRQLALDGADVMQRLNAGPGRHVGAALGHLAEQVAADPTINSRERLESLLDAWARNHTDWLDRARSVSDDGIG